MIQISNLHFYYYVKGADKSMTVLQKAIDYDSAGLFPVMLYPAGVDVDAFLSSIQDIGFIKRDSSISKFYKKLSKKSKPDCIIIGSGELLTKSQILELVELSTIEDLPIFVYGAKTDETLKFYKSSEMLFSLSNSIHELASLCSCGEVAKLCSKKIDQKFWSKDSYLDDDTANSIEYVPLCSRCYMLRVGKIDDI